MSWDILLVPPPPTVSHTLPHSRRGLANESDLSNMVTEGTGQNIHIERRLFYRGFVKKILLSRNIGNACIAINIIKRGVRIFDVQLFYVLHAISLDKCWWKCWWIFESLKTRLDMQHHNNGRPRNTTLTSSHYGGWGYHILHRRSHWWRNQWGTSIYSWKRRCLDNSRCYFI